MRRSEFIGLTTIACIGLAALALGRQTAMSVEASATGRIDAALEDIGFTDLDVDADGLVVEVSGQVRSAADHDVIRDRLARVEGVERIVDNIVVVAPLVDLRPAVLRVQNDGRTLTMTGEAPNAEARDLLGARLDMASGALAFTNLMRAQDRRASDAWMLAAEAAIEAVAALRVGEASVERDRIRIAGAAFDSESRDRIVADLRARLTGDFTLEFEIDAPPPLLSPYEFAARKTAEEGFVVLACAAPNAAERSSALGALVGVGAAQADPSAVELCQVANGAPNDQWTDALIRAVAALDALAEGEVRIRDDQVELIGFAPDGASVEDAAAAARAGWPELYAVVVDVTAAPPTVRPFQLTAIKRPGDVRLSGYAPSRDRARAWSELLDASNDLEVARGAPPGWADAVTVVIEALADMQVGAATLTDRSFLIAAPGDQSELDRLRERLSAALPPGYRVRVVAAREPRFPSPPDPSLIDGEDEEAIDPTQYVFSASRSEDGGVTVAGLSPDAAARAVIGAYARAQLGGDAMTESIRVSAAPAPAGWRSALFAGLEALSYLQTGEMIAEPEALFLQGVAQSAADARRATAALSAAPGEFARFSRIEVVEFGPERDPDDRLGPRLDPEACVAALNEAVGAAQIVFESGSATIDAGSQASIDELAILLRRCPDVVVEVGGHTDSRGSEETNLALSRQRAQAVRLSLIARGVNPDRLTAQGYGEAEPVADNETDEGRASNRRIEFRLAAPGDGVSDEDG